MDARRAFLRSTDVQTAGVQLDLGPFQIDQLRGAQAVAIGDQDHRRITVTMPAVTRFDGELVHLDSIFGSNSAGVEALRRTFPMQPSDAGGAARAIHQCAVVQIPDVRVDPYYKIQDVALTSGFRALLAVPMLRDGRAIGATVGRAEAGLFGDMHVQLLGTFAAQAVIAIENTRLLNELRESLQQQTATADVLKVISSSPGELEPVFNAMLENAVRICEAKFGNLLLYDGGAFRFTALHNAPPAWDHLRRNNPSVRPGPNNPLCRMAATKQLQHIADIRKEQAYIEREPLIVSLAELAGARTVVGVPMLRENELIGAIGIYRQEVRPFTDRQIELVKNFAAQAVIAIENTRLLKELRQRTDDLSESLEQQTATAEVLGVISGFPGELEPVFQAMLANAMRICEAKFGHLVLYDGEGFRAAYLHDVPKAYRELWDRGPVRPGPKTGLRRVLDTKQVVHIADLAAEPAYAERDPLRVATVEIAGGRTFLGVPMLKENQLVGAIIIYRQEVRPFSDKQIELVTNFAAQAVIAIENTRLLNELRESLQQQTATADV